MKPNASLMASKFKNGEVGRKRGGHNKRRSLDVMNTDCRILLSCEIFAWISVRDLKGYTDN